MPLWKPDPTFYPSPRLAMQGPPENLAYVVVFNPRNDGRPDAMTVVDLAPKSPTYGKVVSKVEMPNAGDELHHLGWNACSSALCPYGPHPHVERRYLVVPGLRSSRIHILDIKPDARHPQIVKVIEPEEVFGRARYSRFHTIHCGPEGIYIRALGSPEGDAPGGVFLLDRDSFGVLGQWEMQRGPQSLAYDFWWHLGHDTMVTSEWGTPNMIEGGLNPDLLLNNAVVSLKDLSSSIWRWNREDGGWGAEKVIEIPAEPAGPDRLPPLLQGFKAVPPLVTDINLSLDDRFLYVSCWGTGEMRAYDVSDPYHPKLTGSVHLGGIVRRGPHPANPGEPLNGGPQMVEVSRDGRRVYFTNSLYRAWDKQFYPEGIRSWMVKLNADAAGRLTVDPGFFVEFDGYRSHQIRPKAGTARPIPSAIHDRILAVGDAVRPRRLSRHQSGHELVVCRGPGSAGKEPAGRARGPAADRAGARPLHRHGGGRAVAGASAPAGKASALRGGGHSVCLRVVPAGPLAALEMGGDARRLSRPHVVVLFDGFGPRRGNDAGSHRACLASGQRRRAGRARFAFEPSGGHGRLRLNELAPMAGGRGDAYRRLPARRGVVALLVYEKLGVAILRRAWVNLDLVWMFALIASGILILFIP